jgi:predicted Zn finger-like uncharacterized protein
MEITCSHCQSRFNVSDEKLPSGKIAVMRCPNCKGKISIDLRERPEDSGPENLPGQIGGYDPTAEIEDDYDPSERPFDFLEEEAKTAIVCENDAKVLKAILPVLDIMEYSTSVAENLRDALRKMKYHNYDMVLVNETFDAGDPDTNGILIYLERMLMEIRRNMFVGLLTRRYRTMDRMAAFLKSVNITINVADVDKIDRILSRGINEYDLFYAIYKDSAKKLGVA